MSSESLGSLSPKERQALFIELATRAEGITAQEAFEEGKTRGDSVTIEAYHNLARRLSHRGLLVHEKDGRHSRYRIATNIDGQWLDEEQLATIIDSDYPLIALAVMKESIRQLQDIPENVWIEARERLRGVKAPKLFVDALKAYADNLVDELKSYIIESENAAAIHEMSKLKKEVENSLAILKQVGKFGLGLSNEALKLPANLDIAVAQLKRDGALKIYDEEILKEEIGKRVADEFVINDVEPLDENKDLLIAAVDGSSRGGLLAFDGENGDFAVGHAPMVSINTSTAQINRSVKVGDQTFPAFLRLPEKPEDMQRLDNRYTIMAKLFFPDLSDSQYAHSVWNAMDVLESRAALKVMSRWYTSKNALEVRPADVVLKDGSIIPQDRDSSHYKQQDSYGQVVRDLIEVNWELVKKSRDDGQTVAGVVKNAQVRVLSPVVNWYLCHLATKGQNSQLKAWPLGPMNHLPDQVLLTRILTAGRRPDDIWTRTCLILRPFHSASDFALRYSRVDGQRPVDIMLNKAIQVKTGKTSDMSEEEKYFWSNFRGERDVYVQMLQNVWYSSFYLGAVPRLDIEKFLPRMEFAVMSPVEEDGKFPKKEVDKHRSLLLSAIKSMGFEVSSEHSMFASVAKLDVLPALLIRVHDTVKIWATELLSRVQEYIGYHLARMAKTTSIGGVRVRQWKKAELESWARQLRRERDGQAGMLDTHEEEKPRLVQSKKDQK